MSSIDMYYCHPCEKISSVQRIQPQAATLPITYPQVLYIGVVSVQRRSRNNGIYQVSQAWPPKVSLDHNAI